MTASVRPDMLLDAVQWSVAALYGTPLAGSGLLNNEIYIGRYVWNRRERVKDPDNPTRRMPRMRPRDEWQIVERPDLCIVDDEMRRVRRRDGGHAQALLRVRSPQGSRPGRLHRDVRSSRRDRSAIDRGIPTTGSRTRGHCEDPNSSPRTPSRPPPAEELRRRGPRGTYGGPTGRCHQGTITAQPIRARHNRDSRFAFELKFFRRRGRGGVADEALHIWSCLHMAFHP
jgi:recombinase